jgi:nucleoside-diphosphate-sugar epimerase
MTNLAEKEGVSMKNVLVVGGAGYVGGVTTDLLIAQGKHNVRVYDMLLYEEAYRKPVDFVFGDVRDTSLLRRHLEWADAVVWLAAIVGDPACAIDPKVSVAVNQDAVKWLSDVYDGRIVFTTTCSVYGAGDQLLDENSPTKPLSVYAETKVVAETFLRDKNAVTLRLGTLHGVGDQYSRIRLDLVVNTFTYNAYNTGVVTVFGGSQWRPFLAVRDAARAIIQCIDDKVPAGNYNLHMQNMRIAELAERMRKHFPGVRIVDSDQEAKDLRNYRVNSDKARRAFGFNPVDGVDTSIAEIRDLLVSRRLKNGNDPRYNNYRFLSHVVKASVA